MPASHDPLLLPTPRRMELTGGMIAVPPGLSAGVARAMAEPLSLPDPTIHESLWLGVDERMEGGAEAYRLIVGDAGEGDRGRSYSIIAGGEAGARYGLATLAQLLRQYRHPNRIPALRIDDRPAFPTRGVMLDVSRNKIPTMASLLETIDFLASLKFNHLQLYTEHTFAYEGHEDAWREYSPITPDEVRHLDDYCRQRGIDLAPNQNCFGHLSSWLKLPRYAHLAETHGPWKFLDWDRSGPFSLCPIDERSVEFVADLLGQLLPCFSSGLVNIGCDETFDVGFGRSAAEVDQRGRAAVYFDFVNTIASLAREHDKRPMLWADIALNHPESLDRFPEGAIGLAWGYEPDAPFANWCERLRERGIEAWVCPGTSSWRSITGRTTERNANLHAAAVQGLAHGATGYLVTDWGDTGHHQHWPIAQAALGRAAQAAWNPAGLDTFDTRAVSLHVFGEPTLSIGSWFDRLGDLDLEIRRANQIRNSTALFMDLHRGYGAKPIAAASEQWRDIAGRIDDLAGHLPAAARCPGPVFGELVHTIATARLAVEHAIAARSRSDGTLDPRDAARVASMARAILGEHKRLWLMRNRPGGLADSCSHYEKLIARLEEGKP